MFSIKFATYSKFHNNFIAVDKAERERYPKSFPSDIRSAGPIGGRRRGAYALGAL